MSDPSSLIHAAQHALTNILLDPNYHLPLSLIKGLRNGLVYGTKIRFPHALVMALLFRPGTLQQKMHAVLSATKNHARNLASFVFVYKLTMYFLKSGRLSKSERNLDAMVAGGVGGYVVFGRQKMTSVNMQIVMYVFARVMLGLAKMGNEGGSAVVPKQWRETVETNAWPIFAAGSWAAVMWMFRWRPEVVQGSLRTSMVYLYDNAETWTGWKDFLWHNS